MPEQESGTVYPPAEAARLIGISVSGLRRYGLLYEEIYDPLPRDPQGRRLWTPSAVGRLRRAKALMAEGRVVSIQAALEADETPDQDAQEVVQHDPSTEALRRLSAALDTITRLEQTNRQLEQKVSALLERLEQGDPNADELRRLNSYLMDELERVRSEDKATPGLLPPGATVARIDRAIEVEIERQAPPEHPPAAPEDDDAPTSTGDHPGASDGPLVRAAVRAARWLEQRLGRGRRG